MYTSHMAVKTISLKIEAYEQLKAARRYPDESFSEVVLRARWPETTISATELLERYRIEGAHFTETELDELDSVLQADRPPEDKWTTH